MGNKKNERGEKGRPAVRTQTQKGALGFSLLHRDSSSKK